MAAADTRRTFKQKVLVTTAVVAVLVGAFWLVQVLFLEKHDLDEDDRPPIIVHNNSVDFEAQGHSNGRGKWKKDLTSSKWRHSHGGKAPTYVRVQEIQNASDCSSSVTYDGSQIVLTYTDGTTPATLTIDVSGTTLPPFFSKHVKVDFGNAAPELVNDYLLKLPDLDSARKLTIQSIVISLIGGSTQTCNFPRDANSSFKMRQLR